MLTDTLLTEALPTGPVPTDTLLPDTVPANTVAVGDPPVVPQAPSGEPVWPFLGAEIGAELSPPLSVLLREAVTTWARSQHQLVVLAAEFAESAEWVFAGSPTPAHWIAAVADIEASTAREWIRIGKQLRDLPEIAAAFAKAELSYSKVRTLTRIATPENEAELVSIARDTSATDLGRALAEWMNRNNDPDDIAAHQHRQRSIKWRTDPDGMVIFTLRLPPLLAGMFIAVLTAIVMRSRPKLTKSDLDASAGVSWPTVAQQNADALQTLLENGAGSIDTEVIVHVRADGCTLDDGTPVADSIVERIAPHAFLRALIHDAQNKPVNASGRQRHPTTRQKRVIKERDRACIDCGRHDLLEYDHNPPHQQTGHTIIEELQLRCAPCHQKRHAG